MAELTKYDKRFRNYCRRNRIRLFTEEDGGPVSRPRGKKRPKWFFVCPWDEKSDAIIITAPTMHRKRSLISTCNKIKNATIYVEGEEEAIILFPHKHLLEAAKILGLIKKEDTNNNPRSFGKTGV